MVIECVKSELDIFMSSPIQTSIESSYYLAVPACTGFETGNVSFNIPKTDEYTDLKETFLYLQVGIRKTNDNDSTTSSKITDGDNIGPVNNFFSSIFNQLEIEWNGKSVENLNSCYAYRAFIENVLCHDKEIKETYLNNELYIKDDYKQMDSTDIKKTVSGANTEVDEMNQGYIARRKIFIDNEYVEMKGTIKSDTFNINKYLINGIDIKVTLHRADAKFSLMSKDLATGNKYFVHIAKAVLYVRKAQISPSVMLAHALALQKAYAKYPLKRVLMHSENITSGTEKTSFSNISVGILPKRVVFGIVEASAFQGSFTKNPFNFQPFGINSIEILYANKVVPYRNNLSFDFSNNKCLLAYNTLFNGIDKSISITGNGITYDEYKKGYTLFAFDFSPDMCNGEHTNPKVMGSLNIQFTFLKAVDKALQAIFYLEFDNELQVTEHKAVIFDYSI